MSARACLYLPFLKILRFVPTCSRQILTFLELLVESSPTFPRFLHCWTEGQKVCSPFSSATVQPTCDILNYPACPNKPAPNSMGPLRFWPVSYFMPASSCVWARWIFPDVLGCNHWLWLLTLSSSLPADYRTVCETRLVMFHLPRMIESTVLSF